MRVRVGCAVFALLLFPAGPGCGSDRGSSSADVSGGTDAGSAADGAATPPDATSDTAADPSGTDAADASVPGGDVVGSEDAVVDASQDPSDGHQTDAVAPDSADPDAGPDPLPWAEEPEPTGVVHTDLDVDIGALTGHAVVRHVRPADSTVELDVRGLTNLVVTPGEGTSLASAETDAGILTVVADPGEGDIVLDITYGFATVSQGTFEGYMASGSTLLWPYHCGNLYPCVTDPADGMTFTLDVAGLPEGLTAVHPSAVEHEAPAYSVAFAIGDYTWESVGTTAAGTEVGYWVTPESVDSAITGTEDLPAVFEWMETTLGPYTFGSPVGPVSVDWGGGAYGGIEHHPRWHVSRGAMHDLAVHAHEAAHGWFGNGVRLQCWEDLVLSEGTANYLAARAIEMAVGTEAADKVWNSYKGRLDQLITFGFDHVAWPHTCLPDFDVIEDGLFSQIPYLKGAFFFRDVGDAVGFEALDGALSLFYRQHHNRPATMDDLLALIEAETGFDAAPLAAAWLEALGTPQ